MNNLRKLRKSKLWTQDDAASALSTTRTQYVKLENGSRRLSDKWIERAAKAYAVDAGDIVSSIIPTPVCIVGFIEDGDAVSFFDEHYVNDKIKMEHISAAALEVRGGSLVPFFSGWTVFFEVARAPVSDDIIGTLCVVGLRDGRVLTKKMIRSRSASDLFHLYGPLGDPILDVAIVWAGRVTQMQSAAPLGTTCAQPHCQ